MAREKSPTDKGQTVTDLPVYWFCLLEEANRRGDSEAVAKAQRELARLGVM